MRRTLIGPVSVILALAAGTAAVAGPLDPPVGPVTSTHKTLTEVEPRIPLSQQTAPSDATRVHVITQPGSYYLTQDLTVPANRTGIMITVPGVTLDLNGFSIVGQPGSSHGIADVSGAMQTRILNGTITGMGGNGIFMNFSMGSLIQNIRVRDCVGAGIQASAGSVVENCVARTSGYGIRTGVGSTARGCAVISCATGMLVDTGSIAVDCVVTNSTGTGIATSQWGQLINCTSRGSQGTGVSLSNNSRMEGGLVSGGNSVGVNAGETCVLTGVVSSDNNGNGIVVGNESVVENCVASGNQGHGIQASWWGTVKGCTATLNTQAGINVTNFYSVIQNNTCQANQLFGIRVLSAGCIVTGNTVSAGSAAATTNYSFVAGTRHGPIVNATASAGAIAILPGQSAAGSFTTTDPNANISQ
jgi:parallel beta-helix repeat protein